jgi:hypothetical protein
MQRSGFMLQGEALRQRWQIFLLYAEFVTGEMPVAVTVEQFLKLAPLYGRDKAGFNLSLVVLQVMIEVRAGAIDRAVDRIDALRAYRNRYLTRGYLAGENGSAPDSFFRLLTMAQTHAFDPQRVRKHGRARAATLPFLDADPTEEAVYILPFDRLWEVLLETFEYGWNLQPQHLRDRVRAILAAPHRGRRPVSVNIWKQVLAEERAALEALEAEEGSEAGEAGGEVIALL